LAGLIATGLDNLLRAVGLIGDVRELERLVIGIPPEFLWMWSQWIVASVGFALLLASIAEPTRWLLVRWNKRRVERKVKQTRARELLRWMPDEAFEKLAPLVRGTTFGSAGGTAEYLKIFLQPVGAVGIGEKPLRPEARILEVSKLDPDLVTVVLEEKARRKAKAARVHNRKASRRRGGPGGGGPGVRS
jgi:hypothetical protein